MMVFFLSAIRGSSAYGHICLKQTTTQITCPSIGPGSAQKNAKICNFTKKSDKRPSVRRPFLRSSAYECVRCENGRPVFFHELAEERINTLQAQKRHRLEIPCHAR